MTGQGAYPSVPEPPVRRFSMTIHADADNTAGLVEILERIDYALWEQPDAERQIVSGGGWSLKVTENPDGLTGAEFDAALSAWWQASREAKRLGALLCCPPITMERPEEDA